MEAVLVAGGEGKRLGDAARGLPKALVPIADRPLCSYMIERLAQADVTRVVVNCAAGRGELFAERLSGLGLEVEIAEEPHKLGRGGGLRFAARRLEGSGPFLVLYGDELIDVDFAALAAQHRRTGAALTVTAAPLPTPFGVLEMDDDGRVSDFHEGAEILDHWVNVGVYVMEPDTVGLLPEEGDAEHELFPQLAADGRLFAHRHDGVWLTVNTAKDLIRAERFLQEHPDWPNGPAHRQRAIARDFRRVIDRVRAVAPLSQPAERRLAASDDLRLST